MELRTLFVSALFLLLAATAMAAPTEASPQTARYYPVPCDDWSFPGPGRPFPLPLPFPSPWPGPTDQCLPIPIFF